MFRGAIRSVWPVVGTAAFLAIAPPTLACTSNGQNGDQMFIQPTAVPNDKAYGRQHEIKILDSVISASCVVDEHSKVATNHNGFIPGYQVEVGYYLS